MVNKVILIGRTGKDPEITTLQDGVKVARLTLATSETFTNKAGEKVEKTEWHNLSVWRGYADVVDKYVKKGQLLYIEGKIHNSTFEKDGQKHNRSEIVVEGLKMLGGKPTESHQQQTNQPEQNFPIIPEGGDDLPF